MKKNDLKNKSIFYYKMEIVLHSKGEDYTILIDEEDFDKVSEYNWNIHHNKNTKYCRAVIYGEKKRIYLHRFLMGLENRDKRVINHIDGNGLNNTKCNLEICDQKYNTQSINTKKSFGCISFRENRKKQYSSELSINKKRYFKCFYTKEEAQAYLDGLQKIAESETIALS